MAMCFNCSKHLVVNSKIWNALYQVGARKKNQNKNKARNPLRLRIWFLSISFCGLSSGGSAVFWDDRAAAALSFHSWSQTISASGRSTASPHISTSDCLAWGSCMIEIPAIWAKIRFLLQVCVFWNILDFFLYAPPVCAHFTFLSLHENM